MRSIFSDTLGAGSDAVFLWIMWIISVGRPDLCTKNPHPDVENISGPGVDDVDKSALKQMLAHRYDISGAHGYQQIAVHTFFS